MKIEYLICPNCHHQFGLAGGTGKLMSDALPDPFKATCPHCGKAANLQKADIQTVDLSPPNSN